MTLRQALVSCMKSISSSASAIYLVAIFQDETLAVTILNGGADLRERLLQTGPEVGASRPSLLLGTRLWR